MPLRARCLPLPLLAVLLAARGAHAQEAPWQPEAAPPSPIAPAPVPPTERYARTPDPSFTHHFQLPSARPLRLGDSMVTLMGSLGWVGVRHGFHRRFDAGIGVPFYLAGVSLEARYALLLEEGLALSLWGHASVPVLPGSTPGELLGFTWSGGGPAWMFGPLFSVWGPRLGLHLGAHATQRTGLGGVWALLHATLEGAVSDSVRVLGQLVMLAEVVEESGASALVGFEHPRLHPYVVGGLRLHSRRFSVDVGLLATFGGQTPLATGVVSVWPWMSASQTF
jgi:hypothetical protein